jgi:hypothetical protein
MALITWRSAETQQLHLANHRALRSLEKIMTLAAHEKFRFNPEIFAEFAEY